MTTAKAIVQSFSAGVAAADERAYDLLAPDFVNHAAGPQGRDGMRLTMTVIANDFADLDFDEGRVIVEGDLVVQEVTLTGTHVGSTMPLLTGIEPAGVRAAWSFVHTWRIENGLIAEHWATRDDLGLLVQLGAWPPKR